jgi:hypothetical protein
VTGALARAQPGADLPSRAQIALRERALVDVLDLTVRFCSAHALAYAKLSLVVLLPGFAVCAAAAWAGGWWAGWGTAAALAALADAPFVVLASRLVFADEARTRDAVRISALALPGLIGARLVQLVALAASAPLLGLPWLWLGPSLLFLVEAVVLERASARVAVARSVRIASARFGAALGAMALLFAARLAFTALADVAGREVLGQLLEVTPPRPVLEAGGSWLALAGWWLSVPAAATARFLVYLDTRTRAEGWDIQTRFAAIAASGDGP